MSNSKKYASYLLPNDMEEQERLEKQAQYLSAMMNNEMIHSPIDPSATNLRIIDIGCGTGLVTHWLGTRFKSAEVFGLDLKPPPGIDEQPPNVRFLQGNVSTQKPTEWAAADDTRPISQDENAFDLMYARLLVCGMTDWPGFIRSQYQLLKPGGYLEVHDIHWKWYGRSDELESNMWSWWSETIMTMGMDNACGFKCRQWMEEAGFDDVTVVEYRWPWGGKGQATPEMDAFGEFTARTMPPLFWNTAVKLLGVDGLPKEKLRSMEEDLTRDFVLEPGQHMKFYVTTGRRPS